MVSDSASNKRHSRNTISKSKSASKQQDQINFNEIDLGLGLEQNQEQAVLSKEELDRIFCERIKQKAFISDTARNAVDHDIQSIQDDYIGPDDYVPMDELSAPDYASAAYKSLDDDGMPATYWPSLLEQYLNEYKEYEMAAVADVMATYKQHYEQLNLYTAAKLISLGQVSVAHCIDEREVQAGLGIATKLETTSKGYQVIDREASKVEEEIDSARVVRNLGIKRDWSKESRDLIRTYLVMRPYKSEELYADLYYAQSVCNWEQQASASMQSRFKQDQERWGEVSVLDSADACFVFVSRIDVAYIKYLEQHFPLGNKEDQEQFNVLLLVLFDKMSKGDVCINLSSLDSVYGVIAQWEKDIYSPHLNYEAQKSSCPINELCERFVMMVKRYAPQSVEQMHELVQKSLAVGSVEEVNSPLVWSLERLYVRRYFTYETSIANYIKQVVITLPSKEHEQFLQQAVPLLFPEQDILKRAYDESEDKDESLLVDWQKIAALMATTSNFTMISGGPGTGKTTTVLRMLLLIVGMSGPNLQISLCAPTGKAAARMGESILEQLQKANIVRNIEQIAQLSHQAKEDIYAVIPYTAVTVQALLKVRPNHATPILNADNKLDCDILVVDEVSMLDLALFYRLLEALKPQCKLILLGDKEQLSSVEAGSVLADLCARINCKDKQRLQEQTLKFLCRVSGYSERQLLQGKIVDHVSLLQFSYRSKDVKDIGKLASLINNASRAEQQKLESTLGKVKGDIYAYCDIVNKPEIQVPNETLRAQLSLFDGEDAVDEDLNKIKQLFENAKKKLSATIKTDDSSTSFGINTNKDVTTQKGKAKQVESTSEQSNFDFEVESAINDLWQPSKPAISYWSISCQEFDRDKDKWEALQRQLAKYAVARGRKDNYAPFLQELEKKDFKVSTDLKQREVLFKLMDKFRILCSNHNGFMGDRELNKQICKEVQRTYLKKWGYYGVNDFFPGQIIIITKNDPVLGLVNGNVGFCAYEDVEGEEVKQGSNANKVIKQDQKNALRVFIPVGVEEVDGKSVTKVNIISTLLLTDYENSFAMSIHKSQGSEYDKVTMVLSEKENRVLTKELVYTGITRARKCVEIVSSDQVLLYSIGRSVVRESGLAQRLIQDQVEAAALLSEVSSQTAAHSTSVASSVALESEQVAAVESVSEVAKPKMKRGRAIKAAKAITEQAQNSEAVVNTTKSTKRIRARSKVSKE